MQYFPRKIFISNVSPDVKTPERFRPGVLYSRLFLACEPLIMHYELCIMN